MEAVHRLYEWLADGPEPDCDRILAAALDHAEPQYAERLVDLLLRRATDTAWAGLVSNYDRLSPSVRQQVVANTPRLRAGVALALAAPSAQGRQNALSTLIEQPCPALAYLLPDTLRTASKEVRAAVTRTLRRLAERVADEVPAADWDEARLAEHRQDRTEVSRALREALRTFDLHYSREVIEISLWLARDLGEELWELLANRRSPCGSIAGSQLLTWNHPRLAWFLLDALSRPQWRNLAQQMLLSWRKPEEVSAVLRASPDFRRRLATLKDPPWFDGLKSNLSELAPDARALAPRCVCHLGLPEARKLELLSLWLRVAGPVIQRESVYALAALGTPAALHRLTEMAEGDTPMSTFARWYVSGQRGSARREPNRPRGPSPAASQPQRVSAAWPAPPRRPGDEGDLIELVRDNLDVCGPEVMAYLRSTDPQERMLGLQVVAGVRRGPDVDAEVQRLLDDSVEAVRQLARRITGAGTSPLPGIPGQIPANHVEPERPATGSADDSPKQDVAALRRELDLALAELMAGDPDAPSIAELLRTVRDLLRRRLGVHATNQRPGRPPAEVQP